MAAIDIGAAAINRSTNTNLHTYTVVGAENSANATGVLDIVEIWLYAASSSVGMNLFFGTFSAVGNVLTCRDSEEVGDISSGSKQTLTGLSIDVNSGDYLGTHDKGTGGTTAIERDNSGEGYWYYTGEVIDPSDSQTFTWGTPRTASLNGTGEEIYQLAGVTKDKDGATLATCECYLFKDNLDNTLTYVDYDQSDGSGNYSFTGIFGNDSQYIVVAWKDNTPHVFDVSDHVLEPVV